MRAREWDRLFKLATVEAFGTWLEAQPATASWGREDGCNCPLHDFIEAVTDNDLIVLGPIIAEHWYDEENPNQSREMPRWMRWILRAVDVTNEHPETDCTKDELARIFRVGTACDWHEMPCYPEDLNRIESRYCRAA